MSSRPDPDDNGSVENDNVDAGVADTILGIKSETLPPGSSDFDDAEANTIIVSFADRDSVEFVPDPLDGSVIEPVRASFAMRIGTHPSIPLEVPAYIGRRPSTPRITGHQMPRLVMVPSPSREVSSTHVEIRQEAETVVVTDLGSTNGTSVMVPGLPLRSLRQGESFVVGAGSVVDIGDGIRIAIVVHSEDSSTEGSA